MLRRGSRSARACIAGACAAGTRVAGAGVPNPRVPSTRVAGVGVHGARVPGTGRGGLRHGGGGCARAGVGGVHERAGDHEFELQPRRGGARHLVERPAHHVGDARQLAPPEGAGLLEHAAELILRHAAEDRGRAVHGRRVHHDEVAEALEQILHEAPRILPGLHHPVGGPERRCGVVRAERRDGVVEQLGVRETEQARGALRRDQCGLGPRDELIEDRERVAHGAAARADDERKHAGLDLHPLAVAERLHVVDERAGRDEAERIVMSARADRADDLLGLGRREDELHVRRRFFDDLEERVEAAGRHHVRLVDDEDLEAIAGRGEDRALAQVSGVVDAAVARRVDLDDVERSAPVSAQLDAALAHAARRIGRPLGAVQAPGENTRRGRLAAPARPAEQVRVPDATGAQGRHQRFGDLRLPDHLGEGFWPVSAIECGNHDTMLPAASDIPAGAGATADPDPAPAARTRAAAPISPRTSRSVRALRGRAAWTTTRGRCPGRGCATDPPTPWAVR